MLLLAGRDASAQMDLSGQWGNRVQEDQMWRGPGQEIGEFAGLPINAEARMKAESWTASSTRSRSASASRSRRIWATRLATCDLGGEGLNLSGSHRMAPAQRVGGAGGTIWMDGRPHPPDWAPHTWQGFSTGTWEGDTWCDHDPPENGIPRTQWRAAKRQSHAARALLRHGTI